MKMRPVLGFKRIIQKVRTLLRIIREYDKDLKSCRYGIESLRQRINVLQSRVSEHTMIHADIYYKNQDLIIVVGRYRDHDYVRMFNVDTETFAELIGLLKHIEPKSRVGRFDMQPHINISAFYPHDRF